MKKLTLDALKKYFEDLSHGDLPWKECPTVLYAYLVMDGYIKTEDAKNEIVEILKSSAPPQDDK